jgi:hypothetical protein
VEVDWTYLVENTEKWRAVVNTVVNILVPQSVRISLSNGGTVGPSRRTVLHGLSYLASQLISCASDTTHDRSVRGRLCLYRVSDHVTSRRTQDLFRSQEPAKRDAVGHDVKTATWCLFQTLLQGDVKGFCRKQCDRQWTALDCVWRVCSGEIL